MARQPLAEVFGYPANSTSAAAERHRRLRLCPFNNKVPNCTKDSVTDPLGVCSLHDGTGVAVICPIRFRQNWIIAEHAAEFFFSADARWTTLVEVRLNDKAGKSAGNIDVVLVRYDEQGQVVDFGSLEVQAVYISGNLRNTFFKPFQNDPTAYLAEDWTRSRRKLPRPDYLSSSRKRLAPQLIYKGGIFKTWGKKQAVVVHRAFYEQMPTLPQVSAEQADIVWLVYDVNEAAEPWELTLVNRVYTAFKPALDTITLSEAGDINDFMSVLQNKLSAKQQGASDAQIADTGGEVAADQTDLIDALVNLP